MALEELDLGSLLTHLVDGLERTLLPDFSSPWRLPEVSTDDSDLLLCCVHGVLPSILSQLVLKGLFVLFSCHFSQ